MQVSGGKEKEQQADIKDIVESHLYKLIGWEMGIWGVGSDSPPFLKCLKTSPHFRHVWLPWATSLILPENYNGPAPANCSCQEIAGTRAAVWNTGNTQFSSLWSQYWFWNQVRLNYWASWLPLPSIVFNPKKSFRTIGVMYFGEKMGEPC